MPPSHAAALNIVVAIRDSYFSAMYLYSALLRILKLGFKVETMSVRSRIGGSVEVLNGEIY